MDPRDYRISRLEKRVEDLRTMIWNAAIETHTFEEFQAHLIRVTTGDWDGLRSERS